MTGVNRQTLGPLIAKGATADVYAWGNDKVIKLFKAERSEDVIEFEYRIVKAVRELDIVSPEVNGKVNVGGRIGIVFERINGPSMLETLLKKPWQTESLAAEFAQIQAGINHRKTQQLPSQKARLTWKISQASKLSHSEIAGLLDMLTKLPEGENICHGDFHPGNIILAERGPVIIDWIDATSGNPDADLARTVLLIDKLKKSPEGFNFVNRMKLDISRELFYSYYVKAYAEIRPFSYESLHAWLPIVAAARLEEKIAGEEQQLIELVRNPS
jgi:aminoglycoside phosphotransferase (APT) family kinase protein